MSKVRVANFSISLDGYGAGPDQSLHNPLGVGGMAVHGWVFPTKTFHKMMGNEGGTTGVDETYSAESFENVGAWVLGRNMFGPIRGPWPNEDWKGWWGDTPPYHIDVFVLTHHPRAKLTMNGGTVFHFVTDGSEVALERAKVAAKGKDVRIGGGVSTIRQYLEKQLIDELHLAVSPVLLGRGEPLLAGLDLPSLGYVCEPLVESEGAAHFMVTRRNVALC